MNLFKAGVEVESHSYADSPPALLWVCKKPPSMLVRPTYSLQITQTFSALLYSVQTTRIVHVQFSCQLWDTQRHRMQCNRVTQWLVCLVKHPPACFQALRAWFASLKIVPVCCANLTRKRSKRRLGRSHHGDGLANKHNHHNIQELARCSTMRLTGHRKGIKTSIPVYLVLRMIWALR